MMKTITWKIHLKSGPDEVFQLLATSGGRTKFWSEKATEKDGVIHFLFPNGHTYDGQILKNIGNKEFHLDYFNSLVKFQLERAEDGGTNLTLINENVSESDFSEVHAGWISVLMNLKAVADFQCDLRNHDPKRTWDQGYVDN
ncbi:SRPBCC family protein [Ulvibacterium sp.]|uniref:SRPBCC family protein n=1 Tax=Ulvibacterium sp. TaxID=2665914 RepID=UPI003BA9D56A